MKEDQRRDNPSFPAEWLIEIIEGVESVLIRKERVHVCIFLYTCFQQCVQGAQVGGRDLGIL